MKFNYPNYRPILEIIQNPETSPENVAELKFLSEKIGKLTLKSLLAFHEFLNPQCDCRNCE